MILNLKTKFYCIQDGTIYEKIIASGISMKDAGRLQERITFYKNWGEANEVLKDTENMVKLIKERLMEDSIRFVDIASDVLNQVEVDDVIEMIYNKNYEDFYNDLQITSKDHYKEILETSDEERYSIKRIENVVEYSVSKLVKYMEGLSHIDLVRFIKDNYDQDFNI